MKLYDCSIAPSPRRVNIFLAEKGVTLDVQQIDLRANEQLGEAFREINPDCTVPVLELDDGTRLTEVLAICLYIEELYPEPKIMGRDAKERALVLMWNAKIEQQGLGAIGDGFRNRAKGFKDRALTGPHNIEQIPALAERGLYRAPLFFDRINEHLASHQYMIGETFTLADITAFIAMKFAAWLKIDAGEQRLHLQRWFDEIKERPAFND